MQTYGTIITKGKMSPASIGGGSHLLFPMAVQSVTKTPVDGAVSSLIEQRERFYNGI